MSLLAYAGYLTIERYSSKDKSKIAQNFSIARLYRGLLWESKIIKGKRVLRITSQGFFKKKILWSKILCEESFLENDLKDNESYDYIQGLLYDASLAVENTAYCNDVKRL